MKKIIFALIVFGFSACSIFQSSETEQITESETESTDEVYVFDEVTENDVEAESEKIKEIEKEVETLKTESDIFDETAEQTETVTTSNNLQRFYLQLGAFSTLKRAEIFVNENNSKIDFPLSIMYNSSTSLYNVRSTAYNTRQEVEEIKSDFWKRNMFKDAFIVTE